MDDFNYKRHKQVKICFSSSCFSCSIEIDRRGLASSANIIQGKCFTRRLFLWITIANCRNWNFPCNRTSKIDCRYFWDSAIWRGKVQGWSGWGLSPFLFKFGWNREKIRRREIRENWDKRENWEKRENQLKSRESFDSRENWEKRD